MQCWDSDWVYSIFIRLTNRHLCLQGPTSSGKTTLVSYLAAKTGHRCIRINNHEGTDLQEYLGSYVSDEQGRLVFREGVLVTALREGHWVVLDELNLAPSEVLEALNRSPPPLPPHPHPFSHSHTWLVLLLKLMWVGTRSQH
jgi:hypothetical protein